MEKKEEKVKEISELLKGEIEPQMERLRREKETFYIWKSGELELSKLNKQLRGYEYFQKSKLQSSLNREVSELSHRVENVRQKRIELSRTVQDLENQQQKCISEKQNQSTEIYKTLDEKLKKEKQYFIEKESELKNAKRRIEDIDRNKEKNSQAIREAEQFISNVVKRLEFNKKVSYILIFCLLYNFLWPINMYHK